MPTSHTIGQSFIELKEADSTNNYAMAAAKDDNAFHGLVWYTNNQTSGRGQRGNTWSSKPGENLALSALLDTSSLSLSQQFSIIVLAALAVYDLLKPIGNKNLKIKWPNDIYINDKKAVGILTESVIKGHKWQWTVIGIGINVNQSSFEESSLHQKATSLFQITGAKIDTRQLAEHLCEKLENRWQELLKKGFLPLLDEYNQYLYKKGMDVLYMKQDGAIFSCKLDHVDADGKLHVQTDEGNAVYNFGEIQLILSDKK